MADIFRKVLPKGCFENLTEILGVNSTNTRSFENPKVFIIRVYWSIIPIVEF